MKAEKSGGDKSRVCERKKEGPHAHILAEGEKLRARAQKRRGSKRRNEKSNKQQHGVYLLKEGEGDY